MSDDPEAGAADDRIDREWLIGAIRQYQSGWRNIGASARDMKNYREYHEARGAYIALRQVRKLLLNDPDPTDKGRL